VACDIGFIASGAPLSAVAPACIALCPLLLRHKLRAEIFAGSAPLAIAVAVVVPAVLLVAAIPVLTAAQRWRFSALASVSLDRPDPASRLRQARGLRAWLGREATWRQLSYHLVVGPVLAAAGLIAVGMLGLGLALCLVFFWISAVNGTHPLQVRAALTVAGFALLGAVPWMLRWVRRADTRIGGDLLGPNRAERQLASVAESRSGLVAAADAERRRIERDLHDGAQARLVSLAMNLGLAQATRTDISRDAMAIIAEAQDETIKAIDELRYLTRGLHPAVLDDRGLDAALSALAARLPMPVSLHVNVKERASPAIEAVAYFVVSEALTNIVKHADASRAVLAVDRVGGLLTVVVTDDGIGGADPSRGSGINGLAQRVRSVDGMLHLDSPPGGPTILAVEVPCES
jgi:signal transduction histidine kinase